MLSVVAHARGRNPAGVPPSVSRLCSAALTRRNDHHDVQNGTQRPGPSRPPTHGPATTPRPSPPQRRGREVIGGRVLDASAIIAFSSGTSVYAQALVWTAVEEGIVLVVPSTAVAAAWAQLSGPAHPVLEVLLELPVTVVDDLTTARARVVGELGGPTLDAHALACARDRGWPLISDDPTRYDPTRTGGIVIDELP